MNLSRRQESFFAWIISAVFHLLFLFVGGGLFFAAPEYGVESGKGGVEVNLVAAPLPASVSIPEKQAPQKMKDVVKATSADTFTVPASDSEKQINKVETKNPSQAPSPSTITGDGSSAVPGTDKTTLQSTSGAIRDEQPTYLKNPAPPYPEAAKSQGQEGVVHLKVDVGPDGLVEDLSIRKSSGFPLLDEAALKAVRKWKFKPGKMAGLATSMTVQVPVRFKIEEE